LIISLLLVVAQAVESLLEEVVLVVCVQLLPLLVVAVL
jgi:hypothetical protein